jgi:putative addiction module killer protein
MQMGWTLTKLDEYVHWFASLRLKDAGQVEARLKRITDEDHFGSVKDLGDGLWELKFNNGNRIYYARTGKTELTLILGGDKNGQNRDIKKAKSLLHE